MQVYRSLGRTKARPYGICYFYNNADISFLIPNSSFLIFHVIIPQKQVLPYMVAEEPPPDRRIKSMKWQRMILSVCFTLIIINISALVMPHPHKTGGIPISLQEAEQYEPFTRLRTAQPDSILVLRVDFPDYHFSATGVYPYEGYPQDFTYFNKYMQHLKNFYLDASNEQYTLKYIIAPQVYEAPENMAFYGNDANESIRRVQLVKWLIEQADASGFDFTHYFGVIVFHAGPGQESDIYDNQKHTLWSSFLSRNSFRNVYVDPNDPDYDDYQGLTTSTGGIVNRVAFLPAQQFHEGFPLEFNHEFDILGPLANQFGRILGFPSLNGNTTGTAGTGNFCIMGTGTWNFNGKLPPLPSAWVRYQAGWVEPVLVKGDAFDLPITYPMAKTNTNKLYKIELSEKEYFLIENRERNFIKDTFVYYPNGDFPNGAGQTIDADIHSFKLAISGQYYSSFGLPIANPMINDLRGSEWDFNIPHEYRGFYAIGSGLLIWHIDENVIEANRPNNTVNGNNRHFGVALEEADGIEHLASTRPDMYSRGSPFDAFREDNNNYFGKEFKIVEVEDPETGALHYQEVASFPTARSYYDNNIMFEIRDITASDTLMYFSVIFEPWLQNYAQADFKGENHLEPLAYDFNGNGTSEVLFFHSNGGLSVFEGNQLLHRYEALGDSIAYNYTFDGEDTLLIPVQDGNTARLYKYNVNATPSEIIAEEGYVWAGSPIYDHGWILYFNGESGSRIIILDHSLNQSIYEPSIDSPITILSNVVYSHLWLVFLGRAVDTDEMGIFSIQVADTDVSNRNTTVFSSFEGIENEGRFTLYIGSFKANGDPTALVHHATPDHNTFYTMPLSPTPNLQLTTFNLPLNFTLTGNIVFKDIDRNGTADIILPHANGFAIYSLNGYLIKDVIVDNPQYENPAGSGLVVATSGTDIQYYIGGFSNNRLVFWDKNFRQIPSLTKTLARQMRVLPFFTGQTIYQATDDGRIYNINSPELAGLTITANYNRNAYWHEETHNSYQTNATFIKSECYVYPNPFIYQHHERLRFRIMVSKDADVNIKLYSISGQPVAELTKQAIAYSPEPNTFSFALKENKLSAGIYFAVVKAGGETITMKFAIER